MLAALKRDFATVKHVKPAASRADSAELYLLATGFRGSDLAPSVQISVKRVSRRRGVAASPGVCATDRVRRNTYFSRPYAPASCVRRYALGSLSLPLARVCLFCSLCGLTRACARLVVVAACFCVLWRCIHGFCRHRGRRFGCDLEPSCLHGGFLVFRRRLATTLLSAACQPVCCFAPVSRRCLPGAGISIAV